MPTWRCQYNDGTALSQLNSQGVEVANYGQIDRSKLKSFSVVGDDGKVILTLHLKPGMRLIYRIRSNLSPGGRLRERVVLVGWQETRNGVNFQSLTLIFRDHIEVIDRFDPTSKFFAPVNLRDDER